MFSQTAEYAIRVIVFIGTLRGEPATAKQIAAATRVPLPRILSCPLGLSSHGTKLCAVHRRLDDAVAMVEKVFRESSIAELLAERAANIPLHELPQSPSAATRAAETAFPVNQTVTLNVRREYTGKKPR